MLHQPQWCQQVVRRLASAGAGAGAFGSARPRLPLRCQHHQHLQRRALSAESAAAAAAPRVKPGGRDIEYMSPARRAFSRVMGLALPAGLLGVVAWGFLSPDGGSDGLGGGAAPAPATGETVTNWSGTHSATPAALYSPESEADVEAIVADCHAAGRRLRPAGSALSPNGAALSGDAMLSMALMDRVLEVDQATGRVRVQAGVRVQQLADALKPYGLALQNYASIREQQVGGFTQVSAHGTGARVPPVDEQVVALRLVTPGKVRAARGARRGGVLSSGVLLCCCHGLCVLCVVACCVLVWIGARCFRPCRAASHGPNRCTQSKKHRRQQNDTNNADQGTLELSRDKDPALFRLARVAMGLLGVVTEVTLQASFDLVSLAHAVSQSLCGRAARPRARA